MDLRKPVVGLSLVTFTMSGIAHNPPLLLSGEKSSVIKLGAHAGHPLHAVGSTSGEYSAATNFANFDSTSSFSILVPDNTEHTPGAASERIVVKLNFVAQQPVKLPPFMRGENL